MDTGRQDAPVTDRMNELSEAQRGFVARWVALKHPEIAAEAVEALAAYERDYPDMARLAERTGGEG